MDKETLSNYGWIVICTLVLAVMIALATPFGEYISAGVWSTTNGLNDTLNKNMEIAGLYNDFGYSHEGEIPEDGYYDTVDGKEIIEGNPFPTIKEGDTYTYKTHSYVYKESLGGWEVKSALDKGSTEKHGLILSEINGKPVVSMNSTYVRRDDITGFSDEWRIPSSIKYMDRTFTGCSIVTFPDSFRIPNGVTTMNSTFNACRSLTSLPEGFTIPDTVTNLMSTFASCESLTHLPESFTLSASATNCNYTFYECRKLKSLPSNFTLPNGLIEAEQMFAVCTELSSIPTDLVIPTTLTDGTAMFNGCENLSGSFIINAPLNNTILSLMFNGTTQPITIKGTSTDLQEIAYSGSNNIKIS